MQVNFLFVEIYLRELTVNLRTSKWN